MWPQIKTPAVRPGLWCLALSPRSVLRDHRGGVEVIVQPGAEDVLVNLGTVDGCDHRATGGGRNREGTCRCAEIDIKILGLRGPVVAQHTNQEGERGFDAASYS